MAQVTLKGNPFRTSGELPAVGAKAPPFKLTTGDSEGRRARGVQGEEEGPEHRPQPRHPHLRHVHAPVQQGSVLASQRGGAGGLGQSPLRRQALLHHRGALERGPAIAHAEQGLRQGLRRPLAGRPARRPHRPRGGGARRERQGDLPAARDRDRQRARLRCRVEGRQVAGGRAALFSMWAALVW